MKSSLEVASYIASLASLGERVSAETEEGVWILTAIDQAIKECVVELVELHGLRPVPERPRAHPRVPLAPRASARR